jgi:hypothetical protein
MGCGLLSPASRAAETLDRVVASVGNIAITEGEVEMEFRFENFLEGRPQEGPPGEQDLQQASDRLMKQTLLVLEAEAEGVDASDSAAQVAQLLEQIRRSYPDAATYEAALRSTGLSETQILERLQRHVRSLRLIDQRLRPNAWVDQPEIETYYEGTFVPEFLRRNKGPAPSLGEVEDQIREILVQQKVDQLLVEWLKEIEVNRQVKVHSF